MEVSKVSREDLKAFKVGETKIFRLPTPQLCESARVTATQVKNLFGLSFKINVDYSDCIVVATRLS